MARTHYRACNLCEAMCGIAIDYEGEKVLAIRGDKDDSFSRGHICPKAVGLQDIHEDPDRLKWPVRRTANGWQRIGWDEAFDEVARRLRETQSAHGKNAVGMYLGNPTVHNYGSILFGLPFIQSLGTRSRYSATSVDQLPHMLTSLQMFGHQMLLTVPDLDRTRFFLCVGGNPVVSNGSLMTAPDVANRLKDLKKRGGRLVVVDPRRTETADLADAHHFIRPGTDAALVLALLHVVFAEDRVRLGRLADFTDGVAAVRELVQRFPPERVAALTGIAAADIRQLALDFSAAPSAIAYGRVGACTQEFGGLTAWLLAVLNVVTGNLDRVGGMMFTKPAVDFVAIASVSGQTGHYAKSNSRVRGLPEFGGEFPVSTLAEEIETPGQGQIRALVTSAGNPVLSTPNGARLAKALETLDFMVSIDIYVNETTRHANIILPPTFSLEHENYDVALSTVSIRNVAKYSPPLFEPAHDTRHDWQIFLELTTRMQANGSAIGNAAVAAKKAALGKLGAKGMLDWMLRAGPYGVRSLPFGPNLSLAKVAEATHGIDLGPLEPCLPARLNTPKKRIALAPEVFLKDVPRLEAKIDAATRSDGALSLIGRRDLRTNNSWMHNSLRLVKGKDRCTLLMNPSDAKKRKLVDGQPVRVKSRAGEVIAKLEITDEMMPGVVSLPHGWGHAQPGVEMRVAREHAGVSINDVVDEMAVDLLSGTSVLNGTPVTVTKAA